MKGGTIRVAFAMVFMLLVSPSRADTKPIRVALIAPLTGQVASLGEYVRKGVVLAYERMDPAVSARIELVVTDDQFDPKQTLSAFTQLSAKAPLDVVMVVGSPPANALAPILESKKVVLIAIGASDPSIVKGREYSFIHWVIPPVLGSRLADELAHRNFQRIAFVTGEVSGAIADTEAATAALKERGLSERIVYSETFPPSVTDFRTTIGTLKTRRADAAVLVLFPGAISSFAKQAHQLTLGAEIIGMETFEDEGEVKAAAGSLDGRWYVNASDPTEDFVAAFSGRWKEKPGWASANGSDAMQLLGDGVRQGLTGADGIRDYLASVKDFSGAAGTYSASSDHRFTLPATLKRVTAGGFVRIEHSDSK